MIIDGKAIAQNIFDGLIKKVHKLKKMGIVPTLAIVLVGENPASVSYIRQKELKATKIGIKTQIYRLNEGTTEKEVLNLVYKLNKDEKVNGIIIQRPVKGINPIVLDESVDPQKDIDGFNSKTAFDYPVGKAVLTLLEHVYSSNRKSGQFVDFLRRSQIVLIGKGKTGGYPIGKTLKKHKIPFSIIDSKTQDSEKLLKNADIIISAVGKQGVINPKQLKKGVVLISIGLSKGLDGKLHGDYNEEEIKDIASYYTPTPGGVGPINVACLLENLVIAAEK